MSNHIYPPVTPFFTPGIVFDIPQGEVGNESGALNTVHLEVRLGICTSDETGFN